MYIPVHHHHLCTQSQPQCFDSVNGTFWGPDSMAQLSRAIAENSSDATRIWQLLSHFLPPNTTYDAENPEADAMEAELRDMSFTLFLPEWGNGPLDMECTWGVAWWVHILHILQTPTHSYSFAALIQDPVEATHFLLNSMLPGVWCPDQLAATTQPIPNMLTQLGLANLGLGVGSLSNTTLGVTRASIVQREPSTTQNEAELVLHPIRSHVTACKVVVYWYLSSTGMRYVGVVCGRCTVVCWCVECRLFMVHRVAGWTHNTHVIVLHTLTQANIAQ